MRPSRMRDGPHHLEDVYRSKAPDAVSWYRSHLDTSLGLIEKIAPDQNAAIIDVGGGESTLVDDFTSARIPGPDSARYVRRRSHCDKEAFGFYLRARNMGRIRYYGGRPACASMRRVERPRRLSRIGHAAQSMFVTSRVTVRSPSARAADAVSAAATSIAISFLWQVLSRRAAHIGGTTSARLRPASRPRK